VYGLAAYVNYQLDDKRRVSVRAEEVYDRDGWKMYGYYTGKNTNVTEVTATYGYLVDPSLELRAEVRVDSSSSSAFTSNDGGMTNYGKALVLGALFKF
jgi:hypothetical protein